MRVSLAFTFFPGFHWLCWMLDPSCKSCCVTNDTSCSNPNCCLEDLSSWNSRILPTNEELKRRLLPNDANFCGIQSSKSTMKQCCTTFPDAQCMPEGFSDTFEYLRRCCDGHIRAVIFLQEQPAWKLVETFFSTFESSFSCSSDEYLDLLIEGNEVSLSSLSLSSKLSKAHYLAYNIGFPTSTLNECPFAMPVISLLRQQALLLRTSPQMWILESQLVFNFIDFYLIKTWVHLHLTTKAASIPRWLDLASRLESQTWKLQALFWDQAFQHREFCRCIFGSDYHASIVSNLNGIEIGSERWQKEMWDPDSEVTRIIQKSVCDSSSAHSATNFLGFMEVSSCLCGDILQAILISQSCILEGRVYSATAQLYFAAQLAIFAHSSLDPSQWMFSIDALMFTLAKYFFASHFALKNSLKRMFRFFPFYIQYCNSLSQQLNSLAKPLDRDEFSFFGGEIPSWSSGVPVYTLDKCGPYMFQQLACSNTSLFAKHLSHRTTVAVCTEWGNDYISIQPFPSTLPELISYKSNQNLIVVPLRILYMLNMYHLWHWLVPSLIAAQEAQFSPDSTQLLLFAACTSHGIKGTKDELILRDCVSERDITLQGTVEACVRLINSLAKLFSNFPPKMLNFSLFSPFIESFERPVIFSHALIGGKRFRHFQYRSEVSPSQLRRSFSIIASSRFFVHEMIANSLDISARPLVVFIQRKQNVGRHIDNLPDAIQLASHILQLHGHSSSFSVLDFSELSFTEQFSVSFESDVLVGAHGAALAWVLAVQSSLIELVPQIGEYLLRCSGLWDSDTFSLFGGLARLAGNHHICLNDNPVNMSSSSKTFSEGITSEELRGVGWRDVRFSVNIDHLIRALITALGFGDTSRI